ncbi:MAG: TolC family protein [Planctomycetaceae bacterium]|nr:TolC family protein [Planctomycetaceae bacterium]
MRGRFAALTLLLLIAAGCQFQLAIKPIGSSKPDEVKTAAQKSVPAPRSSVLSAKLDQRPRWRATSPEERASRPTAWAAMASRTNESLLRKTAPSTVVVRRESAQQLVQLPATGLTAAAFSKPVVSESVRLTSAIELPPVPAGAPALLQPVADTQKIVSADTSPLVNVVAKLPTPVPAEEEPVKPDMATTSDNAGRFPVNLTTVLQLAGAENWRVHLAAERVLEAEANLDEAQAAWLPSLVAGFGYTKHDGQIQGTNGEIVDISRNALFIGGGARSGQAPIAGGAGGPARLQIDLSLTDALYQPLVARQVKTAEEFRQAATFNDVLLDAAVAYYDLILATGRSENLRALDIPLANDLLVQTQSFVDAGKGSKADVTRIQTELTERQQLQIDAAAEVYIAAAKLAQILQLDPETSLFVLEERPIAVDMIEPTMRVSELVATGLQTRPELGERYARLEAGESALEREQWRPFLPNLSVGASAGAFGGGVGSSVQGLAGRSDFDIAAVWEVRNLGFGHAARQDQQRSRYQQSLCAYHATRDGIVSEITQAYHQAQSQRKQIKLADSRIKNALETFELSKARIRGLAGLPLEALQAVQAVADARQNLLEAVVGYNQAQFRLMRAIGGPIQSAE